RPVSGRTSRCRNGVEVHPNLETPAGLGQEVLRSWRRLRRRAAPVSRSRGQIDPACERATLSVDGSRGLRLASCDAGCAGDPLPGLVHVGGKQPLAARARIPGFASGTGPPAGRLAGTPGPLPPDRGGFGVFMAASTLATVVSGYVNQICLGVGGLVNGIGKATRNVGPPHGTSGGAVQRMPQAQGSGASKSRIRTARVRHLRGSRSLARGI